MKEEKNRELVLVSRYFTAIGIAITIVIMLMFLPQSNQSKSYVKQNTHRIKRPVKGKLFEKPIRFYKMPRYKYESGYPTLGIDYLIIRM